VLSRLCSIVLGLAVCARFSEPAPLVVPAGFSVSVAASGLDGARRLRTGEDGVLLADSADPDLAYEIHDARGAEPVTVLLAAPALQSSARRERFASGRDSLQLRWDAQAAQLTFAAPPDDVSAEFPASPSLERLARHLGSLRNLSAVALPDGPVFVVDATTGILYRVAPRPAI
jgi:hypothetical protein